MIKIQQSQALTSHFESFRSIVVQLPKSKQAFSKGFFYSISDEIFTLLEPYLKLPEKLSREMAITILHATLKSFWENRFPLTENDPSSFSPGPYIIGSLVPRCFDCSKLVQSTALTCLELLVRKILVLHRVWKNRASSGLEHARKWKFELEHARALENSTRSSFCPGIWLKMHYFCQNLPIFKGSFASIIKKLSIEHQKLTSDGHFSGSSMHGCNTNY